MLTVGVLIAVSVNCFGQDSKKIEKLINDVYYGVPSSPAFELLPDKPSEVTHLATPHDIVSNITNFIDGGKLRTGVAFDIRPFAYAVGSLSAYQKSKIKQILWRTVFSVGTSPKGKDNNDTFLGAGLRISLIDDGDSRASSTFIKELENAYVKELDKLRPPPLSGPIEVFQQRAASVENSDSLKNIRNSFLKKSWNAKKWDVGIAISSNAASGSLKTDSLKYDRFGLWTAFGLPITKIAQLTISGKTSWISTKLSSEESNRSVAGARARFFLADWLATSGEFSKVWSRYHANGELNESWNHLAVVVEFKIPVLGGWLSLAYGGDSPRRENKDSKFLFNYAIYTDRLLKK
jgi:hypothetical protein